MFSVTVDTSALDRIIARLEEADAPMAMARAVYDESRTQVPVDTGALKRSGRIEERADGAVAVVYGGPNARYAASVHEIPGRRYRRGKWQYLRDPAMDRKVGRAAAEAVKEAITG